MECVQVRTRIADPPLLAVDEENDSVGDVIRLTSAAVSLISAQSPSPSLSDISTRLQRLFDRLTADDECETIFVRSGSYRRLVHTLVRYVLPYHNVADYAIITVWTSRRFGTAVPILALIDFFEQNAAIEAFATALDVLQSMINDNRIVAVFAEMTTDASTRAQTADARIVDRVAALPTLIANAFKHSAVPAAWKHSVLYHSVITRMIAASTTPYALALFTSKLCRSGYAAVVAHSVVHALAQSPHVVHFASHMSAAAVEPFIVAVAHHIALTARNGAMTQAEAVNAFAAIITPQLQTQTHSAYVRSLLTDALFTSYAPALPADVAVLLIDFTRVHSAPMFAAALTAVTRAWATPAVVRNAAELRQTLLTAVILHALNVIRPSATPSTVSTISSFASHSAVPFLLDGVQVRMSSIDRRRRSEGLRVAVAVSHVLDPQHPMTVNADAHSDDEADDAASEDVETVRARQVQHELMEQSRAAAIQRGLHVEAAVVDVASTGVGRAAERIDRRKVKAPIYIRDALDLMRAQDDRDSVMAALEAAETIVRAETTDLSDVAMELAAQLLQLSTVVWCESRHANALRLNALTALIEVRPHLTVAYLCAQVQAKTQTLTSRIEIIDALVHAATQLSGARSQDSRVSASAVESHTTKRADERLTLDDHRRIIAARVESRTRRWGAQTPIVQDATLNRFAAHAALFFHQLAYRTRNNDDPLILTRTVDALSSFIVCCGADPALRSLVRPMYELICAARHHRESIVRRITLLALLRMQTPQSAPIFISELSDDFAEMIEWCTTVSVTDSDGVCREMAVTALSVFRQTINAHRKHERNVPTEAIRQLQVIR